MGTETRSAREVTAPVERDAFQAEGVGAKALGGYILGGIIACRSVWL